MGLEISSHHKQGLLLSANEQEKNSEVGVVEDIKGQGEESIHQLLCSSYEESGTVQIPDRYKNSYQQKRSRQKSRLRSRQNNEPEENNRSNAPADAARLLLHI